LIRVAAVSDIHFGDDSAGTLRSHLEKLPDVADALLIAGDLTRHGAAEEAEVVARELDGVEVPVVAVLGNHDHHLGEEKRIRDTLEEVGVIILEGESIVLDLPAGRLGIAGTKGFGGGFIGACGSDFGEIEMKAFIRHTKAISERLHEVLAELDADIRIALMHYSPVEGTLVGERLEIYPFLGSYLLAEAVDTAGADLILHGHAHVGSEKGVTAGGIHVRNVAQPLIQRAYNIYCFGDEDLSC